MLWRPFAAYYIVVFILNAGKGKFDWIFHVWRRPFAIKRDSARVRTTNSSWHRPSDRRIGYAGWIGNQLPTGYCWPSVPWSDSTTPLALSIIIPTYIIIMPGRTSSSRYFHSLNWKLIINTSLSVFSIPTLTSQHHLHPKIIGMNRRWTCSRHWRSVPDWWCRPRAFGPGALG